MMKTFKTRKTSKIRHTFIFDFANVEFYDVLYKEKLKKNEYRKGCKLITKGATFWNTIDTKCCELSFLSENHLNDLKMS